MDFYSKVENVQLLTELSVMPARHVHLNQVESSVRMLFFQFDSKRWEREEESGYKDGGEKSQANDGA